MKILPKHRELLEFLKPIIIPWRKFTIGIDGVDGVGKSPLARFLSWQLSMPTIETDMFLKKGNPYPFLRYDELKNLIEIRHSIERPVIIEGIHLLETLDNLNINPNILIYVINKDFNGSFGFRKNLAKYRKKYRPNEKADYLYEVSKQDFR